MGETMKTQPDASEALVYAELDPSEQQPDHIEQILRDTQDRPAKFTKQSLTPRFDTPLTQCPSSLDRNTERGKKCLLAAGSPDTVETAADGTARILAVDWLVFPDERIDEETGESSQFMRICFFDANGNHLRMSSSHGIARLAVLLDMYSDADWRRGIPIRVVQRMGKRKRIFHDLQVDVSE